MMNEILWENLISKICPPTHLDLERIVKNFPFLYPFQSFWGLRNSERRETFERSLLRFESFEQSLRNVGKSQGNVSGFYKNFILKFFSWQFMICFIFWHRCTPVFTGVRLNDFSFSDTGDGNHFQKNTRSFNLHREMLH